MQENSPWSSPSGPLGRLVERARQRALTLVPRRAEFERAIACECRVQRSLVDALRAGGNVNVIAELKRRSPSKGVIDDSLGAAARCRLYVKGGAAAISVLTEPFEFGGRAQDLVDVSASVDVPTIKKDFHVDPLQLLEARALGATAVLLIARALEPAALHEMQQCAHALGLETIIEVRTEAEMAAAVEIGAAIIGVNSRDLETLEISAATLDRLIPMVPPNLIAIAESGVMGVADVELAALLGADAVLVGSMLSLSAEPTALVKSLGSVARQRRDR